MDNDHNSLPLSLTPVARFKTITVLAFNNPAKNIRSPSCIRSSFVSYKPAGVS